ncbi:MAG: hypothetical protein WCV55_01240 [Candidatus Paceibacterota bacterium]
MPDDLEKSRIEELRKRLYSKTEKPEEPHVLDLKQHEDDVSRQWVHDEEGKEALNQMLNSPTDMNINKTDLTKKILQAAVVFFILSIIAAAFILFKGVNVVSNDKVKVNVLAPAAVPSGQVTSLDVSVQNTNDGPINLVDVVLNYPKGTRSANDQSLELTHDRVSFESVASGETQKGTARAIFFGENGTLQKINIEIAYRVPGSNTVFTKNSEYDVSIGTSALSLTLDSVKEITSGQNLDMVLKIKSNSPETIKGAVLQAIFPFGFSFLSSTPLTTDNLNNWNLGDIEPGGIRTVEILGQVTGETDEVRFFRFLLGLGSTKNQNQIQSEIASVENSLVVKKPFIGTSLALNGDPVESFIASINKEIDAVIKWQNNLNVPISDGQIVATLSGDIVDMNSLKSQTGIIRTSDKTISWSKFESEKLAEILPGQGDVAEFRFSTMSSKSAGFSKIRNPVIQIDVNVQGKRISETNVPEDINSTISKKIKVDTFATLAAQIVHSSGPFENQGSIPPKLNKPTEYTIIWTVSNTFNDINGTQVVAILPNFLSWTGVSSPTTEKISFDSNNRTVTWDLGKVLATGGSVSGLRQVAFQISFTPTLNQVGNRQDLIERSSLSGVDAFTGHDITINSGPLGTNLPTDPSFVYGDEVVSK